MKSVLSLLSLVFVVFAVPQSAYYDSSHTLPSQQGYTQQVSSKPQYISLPPIPQPQASVYGNPLKQISTQYSALGPPTQIVSQLLLPTAVDRQIQKAAHQHAGPEYARQIQLQQQQATANQVLAAQQRIAQWQANKGEPRAQASQNALLSHLGQLDQPLAQAQTQIGYQLQYQPRRQAPAQYQPQLQYQPQAQSVRPALRPAPQTFSPQREKNDEEYDDNASYQFGFDVTDDLNTNYQNRKEQRDGDKITGSYSVVDSDGFIRTVTYTADPKEGFKAEVVRKPTDIVVKIPTPTPPTKEQYVQLVPSNRLIQREKGNADYQY